MRKFSADFIFPVSRAPIANGIIITEDDGLIVEIIDPEKIDYKIDDVKFHRGILTPGFVNSHCHLELSFLKNKIEKNTGLDVFIKEIELKRKEKEEKVIEAIDDAEKEMIANGIIAVGDISNNDFTFKQKSKKNIYYHTFIEVFSFDAMKADSAFERGNFLAEKLITVGSLLAYSITPHAPYSCSKELFINLINKAKINSDFLTIHNQENEEENLFFNSKTGKLVERLKYFGINLEVWKEPKKSSLQYIIDLSDPEVKMQLVHNTVTKEVDIDYALNKNKNLWWCLCPGANLYIENKLPDVNLLFQKVKDRITIGTDSLASNENLSVLEEIKILQQNYPFLSLEELIKWSTLNGAEFLEIDNWCGSLEKGKKPGINLITLIDLRMFEFNENSGVIKLI
ncbi:MAG: amidohydrolase family protein [Bacteroidia bacterium]